MDALTLSAGDVFLARDLAQASIARYSRVAGHYRNTARSHFVGRLGEIAFGRWLLARDIGHWPHFADPARDSLCDVEIFWPHLRAEVKTWTLKFWPGLGRCVAASQLRRVQRKADIVVWAVSDAPPESNSLAHIGVALAGWNYVAEIARVPARLTYPPGGGAGVLNHQLMDEQLRPMGELARLAQAEGVTA